MEKAPKKILLTRPLPTVEKGRNKLVKKELKRKLVLPKITKKQDSNKIPAEKTKPRWLSTIPEDKVDKKLLFEIQHLRDIQRACLETTENIVQSKYNYKQIIQHIERMASSNNKKDLSLINMDYEDMPRVDKTIPEYHKLCNLAALIKKEFDCLGISATIFVRKASEISKYYPYYYMANFLNCRIDQSGTPPIHTNVNRKVDCVMSRSTISTKESSSPSSIRQISNKVSPTGDQPQQNENTTSKGVLSGRTSSIAQSGSINEQVENSKKIHPELRKFGVRSKSPFGQLYGVSKQSPAELTVLCNPPTQNTLNLQAFFITKMPAVCLRSNILHLNLSYNNLKQIPNCVLELVNLESLSLRSNPISQIPPSIGQLQSLKSLDASFCQITKISRKLYSITSIERLWLSFNKLDYLSHDVRKLKNLKELHVEANYLMGLPMSMTDMSIDILNLRGNRMHPVFAPENRRCVPNKLADICRTRLVQQAQGHLIAESEPCGVCGRPMFGIGSRFIEYLQTTLSDRTTPFLLPTCSAVCSGQSTRII